MDLSVQTLGVGLLNDV